MKRFWESYYDELYLQTFVTKALAFATIYINENGILQFNKGLRIYVGVPPPLDKFKDHTSAYEVK